MKKLLKPVVLAKWMLAVILLQTLFFKFSGAPESRFIFETLGMEPIGRIGSGIAELTAAILLFIPGWTWAGACLSLGIISGAIFFHLTRLGISIQGDGGLLFALACVAFACSIYLAWQERRHIPVIGPRL